MTIIYNILKGNKMINIKLEPKNISLKFVLYLIISIFIFISSSKVVFSKALHKNISSPEQELAIVYCDAINKNIFNGLNKEKILKYEYYFSSLKNLYEKKPSEFYSDFKLNVKKNCAYILKEREKIEMMSYIEEFLK